MATNPSAGGAKNNSDNSGGTGGNPGTDPSTSDNDDSDDDIDPRSDSVNYRTYRRAVDQLKSERQARRDLETRLSKIERDKAEDERAKLEQQGNYKTLLEAERARAQALEKEVADRKAESEQYRARDVERRKLSALIANLGGNVNSEAIYRLADLEEIAVDPESGEIDKTSLTRYTERFRKKWPDILGVTRGGLPNKKPSDPAIERISYDDYRKLPSKEMEEWAKKESKNPGTITGM